MFLHSAVGNIYWVRDAVGINLTSSTFAVDNLIVSGKEHQYGFDLTAVALACNAFALAVILHPPMLRLPASIEAQECERVITCVESHL